MTFQVLKHPYFDCPTYDEYLKRYYASEEGRELNRNYAALYEELQDKTGWTNNDPLICYSTYFGILSEVRFSHKLFRTLIYN